MFGLLGGLAGLGYMLANPRRKARKVRRSRKTRRARKTVRRGAYRYRVMVTKREAAVIRTARSTRMSAIAAKRKLTSVADAILGSHYKVNPHYSPMWMTASERDLIESARSAAMKAVAAKRHRRSASALEGTGEAYESYTMDNPWVKFRTRRGKRVRFFARKRR